MELPNKAILFSCAIILNASLQLTSTTSEHAHLLDVDRCGSVGIKLEWDFCCAGGKFVEELGANRQLITSSLD